MTTQQRAMGWLLGLLLVAVSLLGCAQRDGGPPPTPSPASSGVAVAPPATATLAPTRTPLRSPTPTLSPTPTPPAAVRLEQAREADRIGDWPLAFALYESLRTDPRYGHTALFYLGDLYARDDRVVEAASAWQQALVLDPDGRFATPTRYRLAVGLAAVGQHRAAIDLLQQVDEETDDADPMVAERLAESYEAVGERELAAAQWERLYDLPTTDRVTRALTAERLGAWHAENERWAEALAWYERTLDGARIESYRAEIIALLAEIALDLGDENYAYNQWHILIEEYPDQPQALAAAEALAGRGEPLSRFEMGDLLLANGRWAEAARAFFDSLDEEADRAEAHAGAARALAGGGNLTTALDEWQKILADHPDAEDLQPVALLEIGRLHRLLGETEAAQAAWASLVEQFPGSEAAPEALWASALALRASGASTDEVARAYEAVAEADPDAEQAAAALWEAGHLWYGARDYERARAAFVSGAERDETQPARALFWAGKAAEAAGDDEAAEALWRAAVAAAPSNYYGLRAAALADGETWQPRAETAVRRPRLTDSELDWLRDAAGLPEGANLYRVPADPLLREGKALLRMGEGGAATERFERLVEERADEPQALWALAHDFRAEGLNRLSILAAQRLMASLGYTPLDAPLALAELVYPLPYLDILEAAADRWNVDPLFFAALIFQESRWEPRARSSAAARGLTQVIPDTGSWIAMRLGDDRYRYRDLDRPLIALRYGGYYLDYVLDTFDDDPFLALAAYNGGPGNARRWQQPDTDQFVEEITATESRNYVRWIYEHWHAYRRIYSGE